MKFTSAFALLTAGLMWASSASARDARYTSSHSNGTQPVTSAGVKRHDPLFLEPALHPNVGDIREKRGTCKAVRSPRSHSSKVKRQAAGKVNAAYFTNWSQYARKYFPTDIPAESLTHINYAFATIDPVTGRTILSDAYADTDMHYSTDSWTETGNNLYGNFKQFLGLKKTYRQLKLVLSIGGWSYSPLFPPMASDTTKRAAFVKSAVDLVRNYGLDGLDIDWEFPNNANDAANYVSLVKELRAGLDAYASSVGQSNPYILTIAAPCGAEHYGKLNMAGMDPYLTYWNLMGYDYSGEWSTVAANQANLLGAAPSSADCIAAYLSRGVPAGKVVLGMPIYGRGFDNTAGMGKSFSGVGYGTFGGGVYDYWALPPAGATENYDAATGAAWSYDAKVRRLISYDNPAVVKQKVAYLLSKSLAGAMFWELSGDNASPDRSLILTAAKALGSLEQSLNHLSYPQSKFDNVRAGIPAIVAVTPAPPPTTTTSTAPTSTGTSGPMPNPPVTDAAIGATCNANSNCQSASCVSGKCVPQLGLGWLGGYCNQTPQCGTGQHCFANACRTRKDYGGACTLDDTCLSGRCSPLMKKCIPTAGSGWLGAYCTNTSQCANNTTCTNNACALAPQAIGSNCTADADCLSTRCSPMKKKCIPLSGAGKVGDFCTNTSQCGSNSTCTDDACTLVKKDVGGDCAADTDCLSTRCSPMKKKCIPLWGAGKVGDFCTNTSQCGSNSTCTDNLCAVAKLAVGANCTVDDTCLSGRCSPMNKRCIPMWGQGALNDYCTNNSQCANNSCIDNSCKTLQAIGANCTADAECTSTRCSPTKQKCIPQWNMGAVGDFCTNNSQCGSGSCINNACDNRKAIGQTCAVNGDCFSNTCSSAQKKCLPVWGEGVDKDFCVSDGNCVNLSCVLNACGPKLEPGSTCVVDQDCLSSRCNTDENKCIPIWGQGTIGQFCNANNQCDSGNCASKACAPPTAPTAPKAAVGGACAANDDCISNRCSALTQKCIPTKGAGVKGDFCTRSTQCASDTCTDSACA